MMPLNKPFTLLFLCLCVSYGALTSEIEREVSKDGRNQLWQYEDKPTARMIQKRFNYNFLRSWAPSNFVGIRTLSVPVSSRVGYGKSVSTSSTSDSSSANSPTHFNNFSKKQRVYDRLLCMAAFSNPVACREIGS